MSPSGKAPDFDSGIRRFKSGHPSQQKRDANASLFCWLGWAPVRTEPRMRRRCTFAARRSGSSLTRRRACESRSEAELPANLFISNIHRTRRDANASLFCWLGWAPVRTEPRMRRRCTFAAMLGRGWRPRQPVCAILDILFVGTDVPDTRGRPMVAPTHSKFIYKAIDATAFLTDLKQRSDNLPLVDKVYLLSLYISPNICYNIISSGAIIILEES